MLHHSLSKAKPQWQNGKKTVWDDRPGGYTQADVQSVCTAAIKLNVEGKATVKTGQYMIQTRLGRPICVRHDVHKNQDSCYPIGINFRQDAPPSVKLNEPCPAGTGNDVDRVNRKENVNCKDVV